MGEWLLRASPLRARARALPSPELSRASELDSSSALLLLLLLEESAAASELP
jgi:hypothetical protein